MKKTSIMQTTNYFDSHTPLYHAERYKYILSFVQKTSSSDSTFIDLGCGGGNIISCFKEKTMITNFTGVDTSVKLLEKARFKTSATIYEASVIDPDLHIFLKQHYDYAMIGQVLHHLVSSSRDSSKRNARRTLINAWRILKPGGFLLVCEPVYSPAIAGDLIFWVKKVVTSFTSRRIELGGDRYHNLGAPVVSFLTDIELFRMINGLPSSQIISWIPEVKPLSLIKRIACINKCQIISCIVKKGIVQ